MILKQSSKTIRTKNSIRVFPLVSAGFLEDIRPWGIIHIHIP
jgi:hypothetical protein